MPQDSVLLGEQLPSIIRTETLAALLEPALKKHADNIAIVFNEEIFTYSQLDVWSNNIAQQLANLDIGAGQKVGVYHNRGPALTASILGIAKCGAAYVPVDREMPMERLSTVLKEAEAIACISDENLLLECRVVQPVNYDDSVEIQQRIRSASAADIAYLLYTSGSTGTPKGIAISNANICHLIRSEQEVLGINSNDRVYQGFSVSFDMWCEETYISLLAGATLFMADASTAKAVDELGAVLERQKITVLHAVPSLLGVIENELPRLRIINAGGEACNAAVVNKWSKPLQNIFYNSYGPTETTVTTTMEPLKPGDPISIGGPLPNYNLGVINEQMQLVPMGEEGQLIISGPGVGIGYINNPILTAAKFLPMPSSINGMPGDRIYLSGDAVRMLPDGSIHFYGRMDDQVKLRGYRMELGEIEAKIVELPGVQLAATALKKDANQQDQLIGYVVMKQGNILDAVSARKQLSKTLPSYMVPLSIKVLAEMPRLSSGKIDRKKLPTPEVLLQVAEISQIKLNQNASVADKVMAGLQHTFPGVKITTESDFFTDLGGHSLLAATFSSWLRREAALPQANLKDIYSQRPICQLIDHWSHAETQKSVPEKPFNKVKLSRYWLCGLGQAVSLLFLYSLLAVQIFAPYLSYYYVVAATESGTGNRHIAIMAAIFVFCFLPPFISFIAIAAKWLLLGKVKEGTYPLWGWYYFRYWFVDTLLRMVPAQFLAGTPLYNKYLKRLGLKVHPSAQLGTLTVGAHDLIEIGAGTSLSSSVVLDNVTVSKGEITFSKIKIGDNAYVGSSSVVGGGSVIEDFGALGDQSFLEDDALLPSYEIWSGSPAVIAERLQPGSIEVEILPGRAKRHKYQAIYFGLLLLYPIIVFGPLLPVVMLLNKLDLAAPEYNFGYLMYVPLLALLYILVYGGVTIALSRLLMWGIKPGTYSIYSGTYVRKWMYNLLVSIALIVLHPIFATVYVSWLFRLLGANIGRHSEISTASNVTHTMLHIGSESFIADAVNLGEEDVRAGKMILQKTYIGNRSFVGNSAFIPQGYKLGDDMLIGVLSTPPTPEQLAETDAHDWFGTPAIALPARQSSGNYDAALTVRPHWSRVAMRGLIEGLRIILPETVIISCSVLFVAYVHDLVKDRNVLQIVEELWQLPFYYLYYVGLPVMLISLFLKWVLVGKYKAENKPMWHNKVWRSEAVTTTYEALCVPFFLDMLRGTPMLPMILRLFGVKVGKRAWLNTTDITEFDMVSIGNDAALNEDCGPQTHLFEDRVMKIGRIKIGERSTVGARTIVLYDSEIGADVNLAPLSLVMKGEQLPETSSWKGSPIQQG